MNLLVLTDHLTHTENNSFYLIAESLHAHPEVDSLKIASRSISSNEGFFLGEGVRISVHKWQTGLDYFNFDNWLQSSKEEVIHNLEQFDLILLRLPRPIPPKFFHLLKTSFDENKIVNRPSGIEKTGSKAFLLQLREYSAPMALVNSVDEISDMKERFPIVLKPLEEYGGKGIVKVVENQVDLGNDKFISFAEFAELYEKMPQPYLAMKFLKNVSNGDKRIIVANGRVLSSSLRIPADGSWICNVAQGGSAELSTPTAREMDIIKNITPILKEEGIFMYGLDTLEDDNGHRVLSEINTLSVGGIYPAAELSGKNLGKDYANLLVEFIEEIKNGN